MMTLARTAGIAVRRLVLGVPNSPLTQSLAKALRARGLAVEFAGDAELARRKALGQENTAVIVPVALESDGGLLTTAKIVTALPDAKVILLAPSPDERLTGFAEFIDAPIVFESDGPAMLVKAVLS